MTYYDLTFDTVASPTLDTDYWFTRSTDAARPSAPRERVTPRPFDMRSAPFAGGFMATTRVSARSGRTFKSVFAVADAGRQANPTDVLATTVRPPLAARRPLRRPGAWAPPMRAVHPATLSPIAFIRAGVLARRHLLAAGREPVEAA